MVATASLAFVIFFGDLIKQIVPFNMIVILLLEQVIYVIIRWYIQRCRIARDINNINVKRGEKSSPPNALDVVLLRAKFIILFY